MRNKCSPPLKLGLDSIIAGDLLERVYCAKGNVQRIRIGRF